MVLPFAATMLAAAGGLAWRRTAALRHSRRKQHDLLYRLNWGETATNNYGFAPSLLASPERFQLEMYDQLWQLLERSGSSEPGCVLELSCGRGGGLAHLTSRHRTRFAVGLDFSRVVIAYCEQRYAARGGLRFVVADAGVLPFVDGCFDVVIDVEASNRFGEGEALFREIARVLRPGGSFLFADSRIAHKVPRVAAKLEGAGLHGELHDITDHVRRACEEDAPRRLLLARAAVPWPARTLLARRVNSYVAIPGSRMYEKFRTHRRVYFIGCLRKAVSAPKPDGLHCAAFTPSERYIEAYAAPGRRVNNQEK